MGCNPTGTFVKSVSDAALSIILRHGAPNLPPMRSFEVITPEADCSGAGFPPKRHAAGSIRRATVHFPEDPRVAMAKISRFGMGRNDFQERAHGVVNLSGTTPGNGKALLSSKLDQACFDGQPDHTPGPSFAPSVVHTHDELTKRQRLLHWIGFHKTSLGQATFPVPWGVSPSWT
jgi:hypothetical protein